jgi:hypothetical protein
MIKDPRNYANPFSMDLIERIRRARAERERRAEFYNEVHGAIERAVDPTANMRDVFGEPISATARAILVAGMKRRAEIETPSFPDNESGRRAKLIVNAARKRDGLEPL